MLKPTNIHEAVAIVAQAAAERSVLEITGGGTRLAVGNPARKAERLSSAGLTGIIAYDPAELVLTARAGTPLAELEAALAERGQTFMFEPYGSQGSTIGGAIASAASGSRRVSAGAVRDHLLGFEAVSGRGERFKAGGKVVKNVTGYDLSKLMCGSWGRLGLLTEVTLKVLPAPVERRTLVWHGLDTMRGWDLMGRAMGLPADVAAAAFLPDGGKAMIRVEGFGPSVAARVILLRAALAEFGEADEVAGDEGRAVWSLLQGGALLAGPEPLWRISIARRAGPEVIEGLGAVGRWMADWAGGLIWYSGDASADHIRALSAGTGGHATLLQGPEQLRSQVSAFQPEPPGMAALSARVRRAFDPHGVFESGRFLDSFDAN